MVFWIVAVAAIAFLSFAAYVRFAPDDARKWHVDPVDVTRSDVQNEFVVSPSGEGADVASPVFDMAPDDLMAKFRQVALARKNTTILGERDGFATYVQRTNAMGYPDYISVRAVAVEGGSAFHIWSRSRYGLRDFGVNKARVLSWLDKL